MPFLNIELLFLDYKMVKIESFVCIWEPSIGLSSMSENMKDTKEVIYFVVPQKYANWKGKHDNWVYSQHQLVIPFHSVSQGSYIRAYTGKSFFPLVFVSREFMAHHCHRNKGAQEVCAQ